MEESGMNDERFAIIATDPRFKKIHKKDRKVKIDNRFRSMFTDNKFKVKYTVDKRGRPVHRSTTEDFKKFYDLESETESDQSIKEETDSSSSSSSDENDESEETKLDEVDKKRITVAKRNISKKLKDLTVDYARGESNLFSESSSDETESDDDESATECLEHKWGELDNDAEQTSEITSRLAVCNMDWDRIRAEDLMVLFNSFLPPGGSIHSLTIYPSEFGAQRMKIEEVNGPTELVNTQKMDKDINSDSENDQVEEGKSYHRERLRQYQLNRLKYYYAIAVFDSPETADRIYKECDNLEYESSSARLDLRFIPDDIVFDQEPKERCEQLPNLSKYKPRYFTTTALQQAKVELTWDETDPKREEFVHKISEAVKSGELEDSDIENFVALSSSGEENEETDNEEDSQNGYEVKDDEEDSQNEHTVKDDEEEDSITRYRKLLKELDEKESDKKSDDVQLEITWGTMDDENVEEKETIERKEHSSLTPFQKLIEKRKEKRKERKKEIKLKKRETNEKKDDYENYSSDEIYFESDSVKKKNFNNNEDETDGEDNNETKEGELELLLMDENEDNSKHHFSLKKIKEKEAVRRKRKRKDKLRKNDAEEDDFQVDVKDDRFEALYSSHLFNIDPADPKFHKTKGMEAFVVEKQRRVCSDAEKKRAINIDQSEMEHGLKKRSKNDLETHSELSNMIKSIKSRTNLLKNRNKK